MSHSAGPVLGEQQGVEAQVATADPSVAAPNHRSEPRTPIAAAGGVEDGSRSPIEAPPNRYDSQKRAFDVVFSIAIIVAASPLVALIVAAIKLFDRGPVLFSQTRVGRNGEEFTLYKFRTMVPNAERIREGLAESNQHSDSRTFKIRRDPRITAVGQLLRKTSLDELPQLWNVLRGDMSLVGPRPALPNEVAQYDATALRRLQVKPGLTCFWQVAGRSELPFDTQLLLDLSYAQRRNLWIDLKVLAMTPPAILAARGAY